MNTKKYRFSLNHVILGMVSLPRAFGRALIYLYFDSVSILREKLVYNCDMTPDTAWV